MDFSRQSAARDTISEGAAEVKAKLRDDLSRWSRTRRYVSLKPAIPCLECDGAGKTQCAGCDGSGRSRIILDDDRQEPCVRCDGKGAVTCVVCAGRGMVPNAHRKKMLWMLALGAVAWLTILFHLWGRDILPEQRARLLQRGEHGQAITAPAPRSPGGGQGVVAPPPGGPAVSGSPMSGGAPPVQQGYGAQPPAGMTPQGAAYHGNSVPPGPGAPMPGYRSQGGQGVTRPWGGNQGGAGAGPYGGGNSIPSPR
jgi:hypothetical protein